MKATTAQARAEFIQLWSRLGQFWGIPAGTSRVYAWLLSCPDGAWSEEIMDGLTMSRGAVSMACKELRDWGLVTAVQDPGVRKTRHEVETDLATVVRNIVQARKRREWDPILESLREWIPRLETDASPDAAIFRQRLESIESLIALTDSMVDVFLHGGLLGRVGLKMLVKAARDDAAREEKQEPDHLLEETS